MRPRLTTVVVIVLLLAACAGDDTEFDQVDEGEAQRQACVDAGKIVLVRDDIVVGCVTVEQFNEMDDFYPGGTP